MPAKLLAKQKGEWAEVCFAAEVLRRGWRVSRPYGDSAPYDCVVDATPPRAFSRNPKLETRNGSIGRSRPSGLHQSAAKQRALALDENLLWRVQIKSVSLPDRDPRRNHHAGSSRRNYKLPIANYKCPRFHVTIGKGSRSKKSYRSSDIDFLAILIVPHRAWYIIPVRALRRKVSISLRYNRAGRLDQYREAWDLLATAG